MADDQEATPVLDLLSSMHMASIEATGLDERSLMLVRIAALVAVDAPPASYMLNLGVAGELGVAEGDIQDVLIAVAPIVGSTKVIAAAGNMARALGLAIGLAELEAEGGAG